MTLPRPSSSNAHPLAGLASPNPHHPVSYAFYIAETVLRDHKDKLAKIAPGNAVNTLTTLLTHLESRPFDQLWTTWQRRPKVATPFINDVPNLVANRLGLVNADKFSLEMDILERHHALAGHARAGLRQGFTQLAQADMAHDGQYNAIAAENALHYLSTRPGFFSAQLEQLATVTEKLVTHRTHPAYAFAQLSTIASRKPELAQTILAGAQAGQAKLNDPYLKMSAVAFVNELQRHARPARSVLPRQMQAA